MSGWNSFMLDGGLLGMTFRTNWESGSDSAGSHWLGHQDVLASLFLEQWLPQRHEPWNMGVPQRDSPNWQESREDLSDHKWARNWKHFLTDAKWLCCWPQENLMLNNKTPSFGANQRGLSQPQDETVLVCLILLHKKKKKVAQTDLKMGYLEGKKRERWKYFAIFSKFWSFCKLTSGHSQKAARFVSVCPICLWPQHFVPAKGAREPLPGEVLGVGKRKHDKEWRSHISTPSCMTPSTPGRVWQPCNPSIIWVRSQIPKTEILLCSASEK